MKKFIIIFIVLLLIVGGFYFYNQNNKKPPVPRLDKNGKEIIGLRVVADDSLIGWLKRKQTVQCILNADSKNDLKILVKNDKVRVEGIPYAFGANGSQANGNSLTDGNWVYMWSGSEGTKLNLTELRASMTEEQKAKAAGYSWEESAKLWANEYQYECQEKKLSDDLFTPPAGINFIDMTKTLEEAQNAAQKIQGDLNSGQIMNQEDIEAQL